MGGVLYLLLLPLLFAATCLVEALVVGLLANRGRRRLLVETSLALNLLTWPFWTQMVSLQLASWWAAELGVLVVEAAGYAIVVGLPKKRALLVALAANTASVIGGLAVDQLYWAWLVSA